MKKSDVAILCLIVACVVYFGTRILDSLNLPSDVEIAKQQVMREISEEVDAGRVFEICHKDRCLKFIPRDDKAVNVRMVRK